MHSVGNRSSNNAKWHFEKGTYGWKRKSVNPYEFLFCVELFSWIGNERIILLGMSWNGPICHDKLFITCKLNLSFHINHATNLNLFDFLPVLFLKYDSNEVYEIHEYNYLRKYAARKLMKVHEIICNLTPASYFDI